MACCQGNVFSEETTQHNKKPTTPRNQTSTSMEFNDSDKYMPPDFMGNKTWLDFMKVRRLSSQFHKNSDYLFIIITCVCRKFRAKYIYKKLSLPESSKMKR